MNLQQFIDDSNPIVFFGGAGVSIASGIPDFRSSGGIFSREYPYPPEVMVSHSFYQTHKEEFFDFYRNQMLFLDAKPNVVHEKLAQMEAQGRLSAIITQNIDGLHQLAGSKQVLELHGSVLRNYCEDCHTFYPVEAVAASQGIPRCTQCHGVIKPDVVLYEESLDPHVLDAASKAVAEADLLIVGGTSLRVYPAAGFVKMYQGNRLVIINRDATPQDVQADLVLHEDLAQVFEELMLT